MESAYVQEMSPAAIARGEDIVRLREQGMTLAQIAGLLHLSRQRVHQIEKQIARRRENPSEKAST